MSLGSLRLLVHSAVNFHIPPRKHIDLLYGVWSNMQRRCNDPRHKSYANYGGRGVKVCERWKSFDNFRDDMAPKQDGMELDRIDVNGAYSPENCRWVSRKENMRNTRRARYVDIGGKRLHVAELAEISGVSARSISYRLSKGWPIEKVLSKEKHYDTSSLPLAVLAHAEKKRGQSHCKRGHELSGSNLYLYKGRRACRKCRGDWRPK